MKPGDTVKWMDSGVRAACNHRRKPHRPITARIIAISPDGKKAKIVPIILGKEGIKREVFMTALRENKK